MIVHAKVQQRYIAAFVLLSLLLAPAALAQQPTAARKELTVERIYGAGQPGLSGTLKQGLQWSPDSKWLSYYERGSGGQTDIWVMSPATGEKKMLVETAKLQALVAPAAEQTGAASVATGLGRAAPPRFIWSPKSDALLLVVRGNLVWYDLATQAGKRLTSGRERISDPKISPDAKSASFVRNHNLWIVDVATGSEKQLTTEGREEVLQAELDWVYPEELSIRTAYWWSPDSSQVAFLELDQRNVTRYPLVNLLSYTGESETMRYPKAGDANPIARVGVVSVQGGAAKWMDVGAEKDQYIPRVNWLRDSKRLAIQRLNRAQTKLDLLLADTATGAARVILTESDQHWININDDIYFLENGKQFLWGSERSGYEHLYLYDLEGKLVRQVTSGNWEVGNLLRVDEKNGAAYFTATEKTPLETHLYRAPLAGGAVTRITKEDGSHSPQMSADGAFFVDTWSDAMTPPRQALRRADGAVAAMIQENKVAELAEYGFSQVEFLKVRTNDGVELNALMIRPPDFNPARKYPVLVYTYGGPHVQIVRNAWGGNNFLWHQLMAQKGYVVFSLDNRGSAGRGHGFETPVHRRFGTMELADQLAGVAYLKSLAYVDGARIGIWGWSYGGYMTCSAMLNAADTFKAGFAGAPVTEWRQYDTIYTERYMSRPQDNPDGYKNSSPATHAAKLRGKLLIAHGTGDDNVHFSNSIELMDEFVKAGRYAELIPYAGRGHGIGDPPARVHLFRRVTQFFLDNL